MMQINITTLLLALFGQTALAAPVCHEQRSVAGRSILIGPESIAGRQLPPPDPERCAKLEETCDCSKIDKEKDMEKYFQCTTNWQCEWCKGLWTSPSDEENRE